MEVEFTRQEVGHRFEVFAFIASSLTFSGLNNGVKPLSDTVVDQAFLPSYDAIPVFFNGMSRTYDRL